jgi:hypothetical protein
MMFPKACCHCNILSHSGSKILNYFVYFTFD